MHKRLVSTNISTPGFYRADPNLYLLVRKGRRGTTTRSWIVRYELHGKAYGMGIGALDTYSLSEARSRARLIRQQLHDGVDPLAHRNAERARQQAEAAKGISFEDASRQYIAAQMTRWVPGHHAHWVTSLSTWVHPIIGKTSVGAIETEHVLRVLQQAMPDGDGKFWEKRYPTARNVRSRIEIVLAWAAANGLRDVDKPNPARWRGHLQHLLPGQSKLSKPVPQPSLNWRELPAFMTQLAQLEDEPAALALRFLCHVATRTADIARCKIVDIDLDAGVWRVAAYSKSGLTIDVPLSAPALQLAREAASACRSTRSPTAARCCSPASARAP
jgi:integrase